MANKKVTYTLELDAEISSLENKLKGAKTALDGVLKSSGAPAGLKKSLESLEDMLGRLRDKASTPIETIGDAGKVKKDITAVMQALNGLNRIIEDLHNVSGDERFKLLPPDIVQKLTAAASGIKTFEDSLKEATTETAALAKAREDLANATTGLAQKEADLQAKQGKLKENTDRRDQIKQEIAAIEARKKALEEAKKEQAKVDAFYSTPNADGTKKDRRQKYDGVSSTPAQAKKKTDNLAKQVVIDKGTLQNLSDELKIVNKDIESYSGQVATARRRADEAKTSLEGLNAKVESLNEAFKADSAKKQQEAYDELRKTATEAGLKMDDFSESFSPEEANKIVAALKKLKSDAMDGVTVGTKAATTAMDGFGDEAEELRRKTDAATESVKEQNEALREAEAFENKIKQFLGLSGAAQVMRAALRDAMATITELDATMTEMAVVTDLTVGDYWDQLPEYSKQASDLGVSINSAYKAATLYYQQGLKGNEVTKISAETLKMAKIAGIDAADATNKMTAALRGFNMELNETSAQRVSDVYSELAAITAADVDEISNAMTKTASIAHSAGMEFETTAAFLSQIIETTRESAETAGTAMKTVIARFQELKKDPAEIGEVDGEIVDANKIETALRSVGVALRDSSGQFRDLDDVFLELSSKWDGLDKNTQRYIATIAAGSRQQSRFIAMMSDYGRTQELVTSANNSAGASNKQFEKTMDSLKAKVEKLKNAWHEFTMGIMESDLVKFGVDILTKFFEIINKATAGIEGFGGSITKIMSVLTIFKMGSKIFEKFKAPLINFFAEIVKQAGVTGEKSGEAFQSGVKKVAQGQNAEDTKQQQNVAQPGQLGPSQYTGAKGTASNLGIKVLNATGVGSFAEAVQQGSIKKQARQELSASPLADQKYRDRQAKINESRKTQIDQLQKTKKPLNDGEKARLESLQKATADYEKDLKGYEKSQEKLAKASEKQWQSISDGIGQASSALMGVGMGLTAVGSAFEAVGLEGVGEGFAKVGQVVSTVGAGLGILPPLLTLIQTLFPGVGAASAAAGGTAAGAGVAASAAWSIVGIIVLAVVAAIVIALAVILLIMAAVHNASPEKKLEDTRKAAEAASEAADEAAEAYEKLGESLNSLEGKYKALEDLTRGTEEWNKAVQDINESVLDLISDYPELAAFVENKSGVLTIDVNSQAVQDVLNQAEARKVMAKNESMMANIAVSKAEDEVVYDKLATEATLQYTEDGNGAATQSSKDRGLESAEDAKETTQKIAQAMADGIAGTSKESLTKYLIENMEMEESAAEAVAENMWENAEDLKAYGKALNESEQQQKSAFDAMAMQAQQLANTLSMSEEQIQQSTNIVDGDLTEQLYNQRMSELADLQDEADSGEDQYNGYREEIEKAIVQKYGSSAKLNDDGEITYIDTEGTQQTVELSDEEMRNMIASQYATEGAKNAIENSASSTQKIISGLGVQIGDTNAAKKAINAMYMEGEGGALTQEDLKLLRDTEIDYQAIWDSMTTEEKQVYGDNIDNMIKDFDEAVNVATEAFAETSDVVRDFMTADMAKGFKDKLDAVAEGAGGEEAKQKIQEATDALMAKEDLKEEDKQAIQSRINMTDWSSEEELLSLQLDLQYEYGYTAEEAKNYINTLGEAAYATSKLATTVKTFGELWKATEKINQSMTRLSQLQWEYNEALESGANNIDTLIDDMLKEYQLQATEYQNAYTASNDDLAKIYAQGKTEYGMDLTKLVTLGKDGVNVDDIALQQAIDSGKIKEDDANKWVDSLKGQYETSQEQIEGLQNTLDSIEELEQQGKDAYYELRNMAKEAVLGQMQKQIDLQQQTLDATRDANAQLIEKIQEQIDDNRQARANQEAEENISNLQAQQSYLAMDTSGANTLQMQGLDKQIADAEQNYQDTLVDQALQNLQDANAKAEEQRERQIELAQSSLDAYTLSNEFQADIDNALHEMLAGGTDWSNSNLGQLITQQFTEGMSEEEKADWTKQVTSQVSQANSWLTNNWNTQKDVVNGKLTEIKKGLDGLPEAITNSANKKVYDEQSTEMEKLGFDMKSAGIVDGSGSYTSSAGKGLSNMKSMAEKDSGYKNSSEYKQLQSHQSAGYKGSFMSQSEYYAANSEAIASGKGKSYTQYLGEQLDKANKALVYNNLGGLSVPGEGKYIESEDEGEDMDITINGTTYTWTELHKKVTNSKDKERLNNIQQKTGGHNLVYLPNAGILEGDYSAPNNYGWIDDLFVKHDGNWFTVRDWESENKDGNYLKTAKSYVEANKGKYYSYNTGGMADFTGPAWLDGTKSKPEYVLNADQTERFFALVDVLEGINDKTTDKKSGDNYFNIQIDVEKLENDYDVEQMANKIRHMIADDAMYRNVNSINLIR